MKNFFSINCNGRPDKIWRDFTDQFWFLFLIHILLVLTQIALSESNNSPTLILSTILLQTLVAIIMAIIVARYSYCFSGKKWTMFYGLLGLFWVGTIGIFVAYLAVSRLYIKKRALNNSLLTNLIFWVGLALVILITFTFSMGLINDFSQ